MKLTNGLEIPGVEVIPTPVPFPPQHINSYLVRGEEPILIDTGIKSDAAWKAMEEGLSGFGLSIKDIRHLFITHAHVDHFGQAKKIRDASGCKVYACEIEKPYLETPKEEDVPADAPYLAFFHEWGVPPELLQMHRRGAGASGQLLEAVPVDVPIKDGERFEAAGVSFRGVWVPGHAIGHMVYLIDARRVMFSADHLLPDISPVPLLNFPDRNKKEKTRSLVDFLASLAKVEREDVVAALPSHGAPILDHRELIAGYRLHVQKRALKIERFLRESGPLTAFQASERLFGEGRAKMLMYLTMSETVGHLELLMDRGRVVVESKEGLNYYRLSPEAKNA